MDRQQWQVYIILCSDYTLYTGISTDAKKRFNQHSDDKGAKYFRGRVPEKIVYLESGHDRSSASKREAEIKKLNKQQKMLLVNSHTNEIVDSL